MLTLDVLPDALSLPGQPKSHTLAFFGSTLALMTARSHQGIVSIY